VSALAGFDFLRSLASSEANPEKMFSACFSAPPRLRVRQHLSNSTRSRPRRNSQRLALSGRLRTAVARRIGKAWSAHRRVAEFLPYPQGNESLPARVPASAFPVSETFSSDSDQYPESNRAAKPQGLVHCAVSSLSRPPTSPLFSSFVGRESDETFISHTPKKYPV